MTTLEACALKPPMEPAKHDPTRFFVIHISAIDLASVFSTVDRIRLDRTTSHDTLQVGKQDTRVHGSTMRHTEVGDTGWYTGTGIRSRRYRHTYDQAKDGDF